MTRRATLRTPAKINLDLRVLHQRPDGYHELRTVFQTISLADRLDVAFTPARRSSIRLASDTVIDGPNLIERAAEAVLDRLRARGTVEFRLSKNIPMGAGLGGGSTNAAAVLLALPVLAGVRAPLAVLEEIALSLGSDVPFFLYGGAALGLGRGEELYPLPDVALGPALLVAPELHSSTADAYRALRRPKLTTAPSSSDSNSFRSCAWRLSGRLGEDPGALCANDFESAVFSRYPHLAQIKGRLLKLGASPALMSGSGSSLFGIFPSREARERARRSWKPRPGDVPERIFAVSLLSRGRYQRLWRSQLAGHADAQVGIWPPQSRYAR